MFVNYVDILQKDVFDKHNRHIGRPYDFQVKLGTGYPQLVTLIIANGIFSKNFAIIPWTSVRRCDDNIYLNISEETLAFEKHYFSNEYISIKHSILDKQVVDTFNRKVVRVNDIHLLKAGKDLRIAHVDVGFRSIVRRLGWTKLVDALVKIFSPRSRYLTREQLIAWKFVQPLEVQPRQGSLQLNVSHEDLASIPPADFSEIMDELDPPERIALFRSLDFETQVDVLNELEVDMQKDLMEELDKQTTIKFLEKMDPDEVVDLLEDLSKGEVKRILSLVSPAKARKLYSLMKYESDSAGGIMTTEFLSLKEEMTVRDAIEKVKNTEIDIEMVYYTYVLDEDGHLSGVVTFKHLLTEDLDKKIRDIMVDRPLYVDVEDSAKEVAFFMDKYDFLAVPVLDEKKEMKGIIAMDDILALAIDEAWGEKPGLF